MNSLTLHDDWYDAETGRYMVIIRSPHGARHRLSFLNVAMARQALDRLMGGQDEEAYEQSKEYFDRYIAGDR